jgi:hypothetical protein
MPTVIVVIILSVMIICNTTTLLFFSHQQSIFTTTLSEEKRRYNEPYMHIPQSKMSRRRRRKGFASEWDYLIGKNYIKTSIFFKYMHVIWYLAFFLKVLCTMAKTKLYIQCSTPDPVDNTELSDSSPLGKKEKRKMCVCYYFQLNSLCPCLILTCWWE